MTDLSRVTVIGAGLAGCEAAKAVASLGVPVTLYEMKPAKKTPAHRSDKFCELVCSNSLRSAEITNAAGLLKEELRRMGSLIMEACDATAVSAGGWALAASPLEQAASSSVHNRQRISVRIFNKGSRLSSNSCAYCTGFVQQKSGQDINKS